MLQLMVDRQLGEEWGDKGTGCVLRSMEGVEGEMKSVL
jgi:hypothetical protein